MLRWIERRLRRRAEKLSHANALRRMLKVGFMPRVVYDIGAYRGGWSKLAAEVIPSATFVLFDANADREPELAAMGHRYFIAALGDQDSRSQAFHVPRSGDASGASIHLEQTAHYAAPNLVTRMLVTSRLDTLMAKNRLESPDLIKLDVQGAELEVLGGATGALTDCQALIAELSFVAYNKDAPLFAEVLENIVGRGFVPVDVCELHQGGGGIMVQADVLFVRKSWSAQYGAAAGVV